MFLVATILLTACMLAGCNPRTPAIASEPTSLPPSSTTAVRTTRPCCDPESCDVNRYPPALFGSKPRPPPWSIPSAPPWLSIPWRICPGSSQTHTARLRPVTMSATRVWISPTTATGRARPSSASASNPPCRDGWLRRCPIPTPSGIWSSSKPGTRSFHQSCSSGCRSAPANRCTASTPTCKRRLWLRSTIRSSPASKSAQWAPAAIPWSPTCTSRRGWGLQALPSPACASTRRMPRRKSGNITRCGAPAASSAHSTRWLCSFLKINGGRASRLSSPARQLVG